jgi:hypothetical protein
VHILEVGRRRELPIMNGCAPRVQMVPLRMSAVICPQGLRQVEIEKVDAQFG